MRKRHFSVVLVYGCLKNQFHNKENLFIEVFRHFSALLLGNLVALFLRDFFLYFMAHLLLVTLGIAYESKVE